MTAVLMGLHRPKERSFFMFVVTDGLVIYLLAKKNIRCSVILVFLPNFTDFLFTGLSRSGWIRICDTRKRTLLRQNRRSRFSRRKSRIKGEI